MNPKTIQKNIQLISRIFDEIDSLFGEQEGLDNTSIYHELLSEEVQVYGPRSGQVIKGIAALKKYDRGFLQSYPGARFEVEEIFGHGDEVIVRWTCKGKYKEGYKGISPKKKEFCIWGMTTYRITKGKIQEIRQFWDRLGILEQIGEVQVYTDPVKPGYYSDLLKGLGMEKYLEKASLLSHRERDCLELLLQGKTAKETAALLALSHRTVESYFENIKKKLKCSNKGQLFSTAEILKKLELL
ncbi:MAG: ester cyclase [Verrucomicrobia bacterium]|nr:ester cyclase [Verrucomicrobiota bacterium]